MRSTPLLDKETGVLVWAVKVITDRGTLMGTPNGNTHRHWLACLHGLGLTVG